MGPSLALLAGALAALAVTGVHVVHQARATDARAARQQLGALCIALALHQQAVGHYPKQSEGLTALWGLRPETLEDPWGTPIAYRVAADGQEFVLRSAGPDRAAGDDGDVTLASRDCVQLVPPSRPRR